MKLQLFSFQVPKKQLPFVKAQFPPLPTMSRRKTLAPVSSNAAGSLLGGARKSTAASRRRSDIPQALRPSSSRLSLGMAKGPAKTRHSMAPSMQGGSAAGGAAGGTRSMSMRGGTKSMGMRCVVPYGSVVHIQAAYAGNPCRWPYLDGAGSRDLLSVALQLFFCFSRGSQGVSTH